MKKIFVICVFILSSYFSFAQNKITGKITDQDNLPLAGVSIFIPELNKGTTTNSDGMYELLNLPNGKIKIRYSAVGYTTRAETVVLDGGSLELNIVLRQTPLEMQEIVVSGGFASIRKENSFKIDVLNLDPVKTKSTPNFMEVLTSVPGVDMISKGCGVSKPVIRGLSMNDILVLNNGARFENYQGSEHHPLGIDEFGIEDVEIIKGPASLLYGSDAIGGVINFLKEKPAPIGNILGDYNVQMFSNTLGLNHNLGLRAASSKFFGGVRIGQKTNSDFLQAGGDYVPNTRFNEFSVKTNVGFTDKIGTFKLFYDYNNQKLGLVEDEAVEKITERGRKNEIFYQEFNTHLISTQNKLYIGKFKLDLNGSFQNTELIHFGDDGEYEIQMELGTLTYDAKLYLPSDEKSEYIIGFQGINQTNTNLNDRETKLLPDATTNNYSAFGLLQYTILENFKLQTGLRYDYKTISTQAVGNNADTDEYRPPLEKFFGSFSGSFGAVYNFDENLMLRANFAAAYRTPNLAELTSKGQHELRFEIGDPNLVPQNAYETDLSIYYQRDNLTFEIAGFYNIISNYIFITPTGDTTKSGIGIYKYKQSNSNLFGGEAAIHFHPTSMPWLHFQSAFSAVIGKQDNGDYLPFVPAHKLRFELIGERDELLFLKNAFVSINTTTAFDQNNPAPEEAPTPGYTLVDLAIGGNLELFGQSLSIILSASNLFDTKYRDHLSLLREVNYYDMGRNISLNIKIPFGIRLN